MLPVPAGSLRIGRAPDNDLVLDDLLVSRYHAEHPYVFRVGEQEFLLVVGGGEAVHLAREARDEEEKVAAVPDDYLDDLEAVYDRVVLDDPRWLVKHLPERMREPIMFKNGIETYKLPDTVPALDGKTLVF